MFGSGLSAQEAHGGRNCGRDTKKAIGTADQSDAAAPSRNLTFRVPW